MDAVNWEALDAIRASGQRVTIWTPSIFDHHDPAQIERVAAYDAECAALDDEDESDSDEDESDSAD